MTADEFIQWRADEGFSQRQAAIALKWGLSTLRAYEQGKFDVPYYIYLSTIGYHMLTYFEPSLRPQLPKKRKATPQQLLNLSKGRNR